MADWSVSRIEVPSPDPQIAYSANAYLLRVGDDSLLIDAGFPGPVSTGLIAQRIRETGTRLRAIALTHHHPDHAGGAPRLARLFDAPIHCAPQEYDACTSLWAGMPDPDDRPGVPLRATLRDGATIPDSPLELECVATPGHSHGHTAFFRRAQGALFCGDLVIPSGSVWIGPPDGHLRDYLDSLDRVAALAPSILYPGHGEQSESPGSLIRAARDRRTERARDVLIILQEGPATFDDLRSRLYGTALPPAVAFVARRTVQAHVMDLVLQGAAQLRYDKAKGRLVCRAAEATRNSDNPS